ncbi:MAG: hypothetical protein GY940_32475, partial [bacterium]|nr:hypothetical protein [bacterium]
MKNIDRLQEALVLRNGDNTLYLSLLSNRGEQVKVGILLEQKLKLVSDKFSTFMNLLKLEFFNDPQLIREFGIEGEKKRTIPGFSAQSTNSYSNLKKKPHILKRVAKLNITPERLQADLDEIAEVVKLHARHKYLQGECQRL